MIGQRNASTPRVTKMNNAQFTNICHHVPITATLQIHSRLTPITLVTISSKYPKQEIIPLFLTGETIETCYFFKETLMIKKLRSLLNCSLKTFKELQMF